MPAEGVARVESEKHPRIGPSVNRMWLRQTGGHDCLKLEICCSFGLRYFEVALRRLVSVRTCPFEDASEESPRTADSYPPEAREFRASSCFQVCSADSDLPCRLQVRPNASRAGRGSAVRLSSLPTVRGIRAHCRAGSGWPETRSDGS
jgi:hypothetical protein